MSYLWMLPLATLWGGILAVIVRSPFKGEAWDVIAVGLLISTIALLTRWL